MFRNNPFADFGPQPGQNNGPLPDQVFETPIATALYLDPVTKKLTLVELFLPRVCSCGKPLAQCDGLRDFLDMLEQSRSRDPWAGLNTGAQDLSQWLSGQGKGWL